MKDGFMEDSGAKMKEILLIALAGAVLASCASRKPVSQTRESSTLVSPIVDTTDREIAVRLHVGMSQNAVRAAWGDPIAKEFAGDPRYGHERWMYKQTAPTLSGFVNYTRVVYF